MSRIIAYVESTLIFILGLIAVLHGSWAGIIFVVIGLGAVILLIRGYAKPTNNG